MITTTSSSGVVSIAPAYVANQYDLNSDMKEIIKKYTTGNTQPAAANSQSHPPPQTSVSVQIKPTQQAAQQTTFGQICAPQKPSSSSDISS